LKTWVFLWTRLCILLCAALLALGVKPSDLRFCMSQGVQKNILEPWFLMSGSMACGYSIDQRSELRPGCQRLSPLGRRPPSDGQHVLQTAA